MDEKQILNEINRNVMVGVLLILAGLSLVWLAQLGTHDAVIKQIQAPCAQTGEQK